VLVKVFDANGDSHTKRFRLDIVPADTPTTTTTSTTVPPLARPVIPPCVVTTTTIPRLCGGVTDDCEGAYCQAATLANFVNELPAPSRRLLHALDRIGNAVRRAQRQVAHGRLRKARRLLARGERLVTRLERVLADPKTSAGSTAYIRSEASLVRGAYDACRAAIDRPQ
jgi:hypothetical protein